MKKLENIQKLLKEGDLDVTLSNPRLAHDTANLVMDYTSKGGAGVIIIDYSPGAFFLVNAVKSKSRYKSSKCRDEVLRNFSEELAKELI